VKKKILAQYNNGAESVAILEDDILVEYRHQKAGEMVRGTVIIGMVSDYQPSLNAFFIDIGTEISGFLPGKFIDGKPKTGTQLVLQVVKSAIGDKGITLSSEISISGEFCVIASDEKKLRVSKKIKDINEHKRLMKIATENCPVGRGIVIRTNAVGLSSEIIIEDINNTAVLYEKIASAHGGQGDVIYKPAGIIDDVMRTFSAEHDIAYINDMDTFNKYFKQYSVPGNPSPVKHYDKEYNMFAFFSISNKIKEAMGRKVWLKSGGTLVFDYTEAMCVIDVNTSKNTGSGNFSDTAYKTNMEAAAEIAVQIRLRNIGGIIIVDFIDMDKSSNEELAIVFKKHLLRDNMKMAVGGFTALGNYEMTRIRKGRRLGHFDEQ